MNTCPNVGSIRGLECPIHFRFSRWIVGSVILISLMIWMGLELCLMTSYGVGRFEWLRSKIKIQKTFLFLECFPCSWCWHYDRNLLALRAAFFVSTFLAVLIPCQKYLKQFSLLCIELSLETPCVEYSWTKISTKFQYSMNKFWRMFNKERYDL